MALACSRLASDPGSLSCRECCAFIDKVLNIFRDRDGCASFTSAQQTLSARCSSSLCNEHQSTSGEAGLFTNHVYYLDRNGALYLTYHP